MVNLKTLLNSKKIENITIHPNAELSLPKQTENKLELNLSYALVITIEYT